jgi:hypothetical protein
MTPVNQVIVCLRMQRYISLVGPLVAYARSSTQVASFCVS